MVRTRSSGRPTHGALGRKTYRTADQCKRHRLPDNKRKTIIVSSHRRRKA